MDERTIIQWMREIMDALGYVHGREIVHRDVKPLNVFISSAGAMKLGDFGLALSTRRADTTMQARLPSHCLRTRRCRRRRRHHHRRTDDVAAAAAAARAGWDTGLSCA